MLGVARRPSNSGNKCDGKKKKKKRAHLHYSEKCLNTCTIEALSGFTVRRSRFAGPTEYKMGGDYVLIVDEAKSQSSLPSFDVAR